MTHVLVIGMSHVRALATALGDAGQGSGAPTWEVVNLRTAPDIYAERSKALTLANRPWQRPDLVCLALEGNQHNVFSLLKTKQAFSLGDAAAGAVPPPDPDAHGQGPQFVPRDMLKRVFQRKLEHLDRLTTTIGAHFAGARLVHLCSPPPVLSMPPMPDPEDQPPGFNPMVYYLNFAACTPALRLAIYRLQTEVFAELAARHGAALLPPPAEALTPEGFLDRAYWDWDPTHGNARYGRCVLDQIAATLAPEPAA